MKAPKLLRALGLSVPILVQGLSYHRHGHANPAEPAFGSHVEARDFDHDDNDKPPRRPFHPMPFHPPPHPAAAVEPRDSADDDRYDDNDPPKKHCNPLAPFCSHAPLDAGASSEHVEVQEKRYFDTTDYFDAYPDDFPRRRNDGSDDAATDGHVGSAEDDETIHAASEDGRETSWAQTLKCGVVIAACTDNNTECACKMAHRCSSSNPRHSPLLTSREVVDCAFRQVISTDNEVEADCFLKCAELRAMCKERQLDCACRLLEQCQRISGPGPSWSTTAACIMESRKVDDDDLVGNVIRDVTKRDDKESETSRKDCNIAFDQCRRGQSRCACHFSRRCHEGALSGRALEQMRKCLHESSHHAPRDEFGPNIFAVPPLSEGAVKTHKLMGHTVVESVSKTSPTVWVATGEDFTVIQSVVGTDPPVAVLSGIKHEKPSVMTTTNDFLGQHGNRKKREAPNAHTGEDKEGEAFTVTANGAALGISVAYATPDIVVATYGDASEAGTLVASAIETNPPAIAESGSWDVETLPPTTVDLELLQELEDYPELIDGYLEMEGGLGLIRSPRPMLTPGFVTTSQYHVNGQPASFVYSVASTSPLVLVEKSYDGENTRTHTQTLPASITPPIIKRDDEEDAAPLAASTSTTTMAVAGTNSSPYFKATDAESRPIYVTRTGEYAAKATTLTFSESARAATTTRRGEIVEYRVITTTQTVYANHRCHLFTTPVKYDKTVLNLGSTEVPFTGASQRLNGTAMRLAQPQVTLTPLLWRAAFAKGFEHLFSLNASEVMKAYAGRDVDWGHVSQMSYQLAEHNGELVPELNFHRALVMHLRSMRSDPAPYAPITKLNTHNVGKYFNTSASTILIVNGEMHRMTSPTQTIQNVKVVMDPLAQYQDYDARHHRVVPTPACIGNKGIYRILGGWGKKECMVEQCMWRHMKPMEITTVFPAAMRDDTCGEIYDYFTQTTRLEDPHWGTTKSHGTYYPVAWTRAYTTFTKTSDNTVHIIPRPTCALKRQYPPGYDEKHRGNIHAHGDPDCSDMESCHAQCMHHEFSLSSAVLMALAIGLPLALGLPLIILLFCLLPAFLMRRHRRNRQQQDAANASVNNEKERRPSVMDKLRRKSTGQPGAVVNSITGQATDPATGRPVQGGPGLATAIIAGSAAGAAAARAEGSGHGEGGGEGHGADQGEASGSGFGHGAGAGGPGGAHTAGSAPGATHPAAGEPTTKVIGGSDDGKGTLGRQAEEGRSRVHFDQEPKPAPAIAPAAPAGADVTPKPVPEGEPHVQAVPPKTDGTTESASGREWADVGSMRGRRRARPEGLNLGF